MSAEPEWTLAPLVHRKYVFSTTDEDQQEVARKFRKYDLWVMPVVDPEHRLVGRITADDVIDVVHEEADEDLAHLVGAPDIDEEEDSLIAITRMRLPWLLITMVAGMVNSIIIQKMMDVTTHETIAIFVPAILAMGGNTGMQSSAICIRGIALDEDKYDRLVGIAGREIRVGICLGLICGAMTGAIVWAIMTYITPAAASLPPLRLALTVGGAMCNAMAFASIFGSVVPVILHRFRIDPALASGPFITTSNDLSASLIYFLTCAVVLGVGSG
jgi:magnesium transporter